MRLFLLTLFFPIRLLAQTETEKAFTKAQIKSDMDLLLTTISHVHPDPWHATSEKNFELLKDSLLHSLGEKTNLNSAWILFSRLMAAFDEGHSSMGYPGETQQQIQDGRIKIFPVLVKEFNGTGLIVRYDLSTNGELRTGDIITRINDQEVPVLMKRFTGLFGGLQSWRNLQVTRDYASQLVLHNIKGPYKIEYSSQGVSKETIIQSISFKEFQDRAAEIRKQNSMSSPQGAYSFQRVDDNIGYLNFRQMRDLPAFEKFLDSVFSAIKKDPVKGLIIDLRQNGGGYSQLGEKLIGYISNKPFRMGGGSYWKISDEYKTFITERAKTNPVYAGSYFNQYLSKKTGEVWSEIESKTHKPGRNNLRYTGKCCVLTGPNTFSSANMLANAIRDYKLATIIGEATGESCNDFGELYWHALPETGLNFYTCSKQFIRANGDAKDPNPVLPDIEVKQDPNSLKDVVLEFAKKWLGLNP